MRRIALVGLALLVLVASCGDDDEDDAPGDAGVVDRSRPVPDDVRAFLDRVVDPTDLEFAATLAVLNKNGGAEHRVVATSDGSPNGLRVEIDGATVDLEDEDALARYGIFSGFLAANPAAAIEAAARRADADDAVFSTRTSAGVELDCVQVPIQQTAASTWCLSPDGLFGYVDAPSVRYELTAYDAS